MIAFDNRYYVIFVKTKYNIMDITTTNILSTDFINFIVVSLMSLVIGLSQRKLFSKNGRRPRSNRQQG